MKAIALWICFFLVLNCAIWIAVMSKKKPCPPAQIHTVVDTKIIVDTITLTRWRLRIDTIRDNTTITDADSLAAALNKISNE